MYSTRVAVLFVTLLFISWSSQIDSSAESSTPTTPPGRDRLARAVNEFGYNMLLKLMKKNENNDNIVISPSGIAGLLAMTLLGSTGTTYDELAKALGFSQDILANRGNHEEFGKLLEELNSNSEPPNISSNFIDIQGSVDPPTLLSNPSDPVDVNSSISEVENQTSTLYADAIVVDSETRLRDIYRDYLRRVYHGEAIVADFGDATTTQQLINDWVSNHTMGKIADFLKEPLPVRTKVVLLSALYFKGNWEKPFNLEHTRQMDFHTPTGDVKADLMLNTGEFNYIFKSQHGIHMISFPYDDSTTKMYVLKPIFSKKSNITEVLEKLDLATIESLIENMTKNDLVVRFPKMDLKTKIDLKEVLTDLGVKSMFSREANFALMVDSNQVVNKSEEGELLSRIYDGNDESKRLRDAVDSLVNPGVYVDTVLHDVKMNVNEYGTLAVAATSALIARTSKMFYVDSPFFVFIRNEKTKLVTFSAVIYDPTQP